MDTKQTAVRFLPASTQVEERHASAAKLNRRLISLTVCPETPLYGSVCSAKNRNSSPVARFFSNRVFQTARMPRFSFLGPTTTSRFTNVQFLIHAHKRYAKSVSRKNKTFLGRGVVMVQRKSSNRANLESLPSLKFRLLLYTCYVHCLVFNQIICNTITLMLAFIMSVGMPDA